MILIKPYVCEAWFLQMILPVDSVDFLTSNMTDLGSSLTAQCVVINPETLGTAWVRSQHCGYWCPGAKAPGHQYSQCWLKIAFIVYNIRK